MEISGLADTTLINVKNFEIEENDFFNDLNLQNVAVHPPEKVLKRDRI